MSDALAALEQDARARREALNPARSMLLQAPAGSGKTTVLTARYLALLASVDAPEEILAMTFTRKAAAEMRQRVIAALHAADSGQALMGIPATVLQAARQRDAVRGWNLLDNPSRLRIDTIDALNYWLASQLPVASRASPGLQIAADPGALYRRAARRCLELAPVEPDIAAATDLVFTRLDNNWSGVEARLAEMLKERSHWLPRVIGAGGHALVDRIESSLASTLRTELAAAMTLMTPPLLRESEFILEHALRTLNALPAHGVQLTGDPAHVCNWRELAGLALTDDKWRQRFDARVGIKADDKPMKTRVEEWSQALQGNPELLTALVRVRDLPDAQLSDADRQALAALGMLLKRAAAELQLEFASSGSVDFSYVSSAAREALTEQGEPTDLALRTGSTLRHILVDEFQDTSYEQLELLRALMAAWEPGDGRTLFVVGDPMQSIYQFREAEVGLFLRARDRGVADTLLESMQLRQNFRSREAVIEWVNRKFSALFPREDNARLAAIRYLSSMPGPKAIAWQGPAVTLHAFSDKDVAGEADRVAQIVLAARAQDGNASIAVLVAARPHAAPLVARLCAVGLPVRGVNLEPLSDRPVVRDLSALTRCVLHGADRCAWLALLRSPWCGMTLAELDQLGIAGEDDDLFEFLCTQGRERSDERLMRLCDALAPAIAAQERALPLWQRVERCWLRLGGPAVYGGETDRSDARRFLDALAVHEDPDSLAGDALSEITERLFSSSPPQAGAIDVMTMHAAKGLEWDVVILPCLGRTTAHNRDRLLHWIELPRASDGTDLLLAPIRATDTEQPASLAGYIKKLRRERTALERVRLLYVATTRARKALHLSGALRIPKGDGEPAPAKGSLLSTLWHALSVDFLALHRALPAPPGMTAQPVPAAQVLRRLPARWRVPQPPAVAEPKRLSLSSPAASDAPEYSWVGSSARAIGTIVHAELRRLADAPDSPTPDYRSWLLELGVVAPDLSPAMARIGEALRRTLADARGQWLLSDKHREAHSEWRLTGLHEGRIVNVIFDRMLVDETGQRWVIDYKTSAHEGGAIHAFIDREAERYRAQMQRYAALATRIDGASVRVALYFALLGVFRELTLTPP